MLADYGLAVANHQTWVVSNGESISAVLELIPGPGFLLIENVAVDPLLQKSGYGNGLMHFAELEAKRQGLNELRLYTNERFTENIHFYKGIGYRETYREPYKGTDIVHMAKTI
jgi:GNAT superfamily N-acetyltransferase